jgi:hypothetical protein
MATLAEMDRLHDLISTLLPVPSLRTALDAIHLFIPHESSRFPDLPTLIDRFCNACTLTAPF